MVDTNDQWIRERTGIEERRIAPEDEYIYMATGGSKKKLCKWPCHCRGKHDYLYTLTPDMIIPSAALCASEQAPKKRCGL